MGLPEPATNKALIMLARASIYLQPFRFPLDLISQIGTIAM